MLTVDEVVRRAEHNVVKTVANGDSMYASGQAWYFSVGLSGLRLIMRIAALIGRTEFRTILDLPCGHGRVGRFLRSGFPEASITFSDLDKTGVDFCASTFSGRAVYSSPELTEATFKESYDLIWVGSLFTHVDLDRTVRWMAYLCSLLTQDGLLVATFHGPGATEVAKRYPMISPDSWNAIVSEYRDTGFGYADYRRPGFDNYGISLSLPSKIVSICEQIPGIRLACYSERAWSNNHDVVGIWKRDRLAPFI